MKLKETSLDTCILLAFKVEFYLGETVCWVSVVCRTSEVNRNFCDTLYNIVKKKMRKVVFASKLFLFSET